jgi:hypothetical protein
MYGMTPLVAVGFLEEILPGTDFIPTATIGWIAQYTTILPESISYALASSCILHILIFRLEVVYELIVFSTDAL